jgi:hypothetical protein
MDVGRRWRQHGVSDPLHAEADHQPYMCGVIGLVTIYIYLLDIIEIGSTYH